MKLLTMYLLAFCFGSSFAAILRNGGFERNGDWICLGGCTLSLVNDAVTGSRAMKASERTRGAWQGPYQTLPLAGSNAMRVGTHYIVRGHVKVLPGNPNLSTTFKITIRYILTDGRVLYQNVVNAANINSNNGWRQLGAEFTLQDHGTSIEELGIYIEGPPVNRQFLVDAFSLNLKSAPPPPAPPSEILRNPSFEESLSGSWVCNGGCAGAQVSDAFHGSKSMKVSRRNIASWQGPLQQLSLSGSTAMAAGQTYRFRGFVKLLPGGLNNAQNFRITIRHRFNDGSSKYQGVATTNDVHASNGWKKVEDAFTLTNYNEGLRDLALYVEGPAAGRNFQIDSFSLVPLSQASWRAAADASIERIRKADLVVNLNAPTGSSALTVRVRQQTHEFGFGSAVDSVTLQNNAPYRNWYLRNFDWAVLENDMKWRQTEWNRNSFTWGKADAAVRILEQNDKKIRCHSIFWAQTSRNPDWVQAISNRDELFGVCMKRVDDLLPRYRGKCEHWDVNNEMVPNSFFQDKYGSSSIRYEMFKKAKRVDPNAKLFLNDYNVVADGSRTAEYVAQAHEFITARAPFDGIGVQGHFRERPNGPIIQNRLDRIAAVGRPIWITELDYVNAHVQTRANGLEDALRAFFSHPSVKGVLFWGFWEGRHWRGRDASLVNGVNMTPNAAGQMWLRLFHGEWRSNPNLSCSSITKGGQLSRRARVFHGEYKIEVVRDGRVIRTRDVTVSSRNPRTTVNIPV